MNKIKYDLNLMKRMNLFESLTNAKLKDCVEENSDLLFVVEENQIGKAVGKKGANVKRMENLLKKKIKVVEFNPDLFTFIKNLILPLKVKDIKQENGKIIITGPDIKTKGLLIGRNAKNLRFYERVVKRYFPIEEIKVI